MKLKPYKIILLSALAAAAILSGFLTAQRHYDSMMAMADAEQEYTIVIDAGHGGEDGGALSATGVQESHINLEIAQRLETLFAFAGIRTVMVRESDVSIHDSSAGSISEKKSSDLKNRARLVNETPHALLLSIHQNKFEDSRYSGAQVFFASTEGSRELAEYVQGVLIQAVDPQNHRQAKPADTVYLMNHIQCTGILVECGFLSNEEECIRLQDAGYQKRLALALCCALSEWAGGEKAYDEV